MYDLSCNLSALTDKVEALVRRSGDIILEHWRHPSHVRHKGRTDLVTETDEAVEAFLVQELQQILPQAGILAEEGDSFGPGTDGLCWIIDPVDGTTNFVHRLPHVGTSVALWDRGEPLLGVVNVPMLHECYRAYRGGGAFRNGVRLSVSGADQLTDSLVATGIPYDVREGLQHIMAQLAVILPQVQNLRRMGAASLCLSYVAAGRLDAYVEDGLKPWDYAAGMLLVREAGGMAATPEGGEPSLSTGGGIAAANGFIGRDFLKLLSEV